MNNLSDCDNLYEKFLNFCKVNKQFNITFANIEKCPLSRLQKNEALLHYIAKDIIKVPQYFQLTIKHFPDYLPKLVTLAINGENTVLNCILLGKIIKERPDLSNYALKYFETNSSPLLNDKTSVKRCKMNNDCVNDLEFVESLYFLLKSNPEFYRNKWNWSLFITYLNHKDPKVKWIACHCIGIVLGMAEIQLKQLATLKVPLELNDVFSCKFSINSTLFDSIQTPAILDKHPNISTSKICNQTVNVSGIYLPKLKNVEQKTNFIQVQSTTNNLRKIALALNSSTNKAICLQGPVGSGKTALIEYLAGKTGRKLGVNFIKVQLGDQTDSKMLLGTYRCTDIPGEFIWQPGIITQAVIDGNWLLLEDIDSANLDIASVLTNLLENGCLTVPGYRDSLKIQSGFQLFLTQRLISTRFGYRRSRSNTMALLEKHLNQINIDPLTSDELKQIVNEIYPKFHTITDRILNVFLLFSRDNLTLKSNRLISTRDFFKWCSRAYIDFDVSSQESALKVLQDAIDVFCCSYSNQEVALNLAKEISTQLGIINQKAEYFFKQYKPISKLTNDRFIIGRTCLKRKDTSMKQSNFYFTRPSSVLLERIICCINLKEPVLLVGETGTGKTSSIQYLANVIGQKLIVINMNQQSDSADLLGGFKPIDMKLIITPIKREFEHIFCDYFQIQPNKTFLGHISKCFNEQKWMVLVKLMLASYEAAISRLTETENKRRKRALEEEMSEKNKTFLKRWQLIGEKLEKLNLQLKQKNALAFSFIEGSLVKAIENGYWVLLDEINLANSETLECLSGLLEGSHGSLCLLERGDKKPIKRDENFTLFACMNPSTDVGKKDLPAGLRNRFTEFFVDELTETNDLLLLVGNYLEVMSLQENYLNKIVNFYLNVRKEAENSLIDGVGHKPHFSLRSLCRALVIAAKNPCGMFKKSLYEGFCLSFLTQLDANSYIIVRQLIAKYLVGDEKALKALLNQPIPEPKGDKSDSFLQFEGYWIRKGNLDCYIPENYILTESVRKNLKDLVRVVSIGKLPVLLQGDTSVGKTSLIMYLATSSGNKCVRINNHEHTDLQEYIGSYVADVTGKLVFREGLLVEAMRKGHWIILDELNLAPTDVLEALNRVLDDNRELFIPETQEIVKANANFMLFATQNPPGSYGGRKMLSRAFRNRFVELHFNEIPPNELEFILHKRCEMAPSYASKMIKVMTDLQKRRRGSAAFAGKQGFITLRDLFRWGERYRLAQNTNKLYDWDQHLADEGYLVLAGRVRKMDERNEIIHVLQKHLKRVVNPQNLFTLTSGTSPVTMEILEKLMKNSKDHKNIVWTYNMRQLAVLVGKALKFREPVLLVGETGGGKTTICKLIANNNGQDLITINCHMHTESSDFIGGLRPVRDHTGDDNKLFEWVDGPLIQAMVKGCVFLADEISLADDSVLERLNSLLEPERCLLLAEKGSDLNNPNSELIIANENFHFIGTMNPGGDFGKKELSPALRNRFTEIWCESCHDRNDLIEIIEKNVNCSFGNQQDGTSGLDEKMMDFIDWFKTQEIGKKFTISIRDILTWVNFLNVTDGKIDVFQAYYHGACLTFLDSLGSGITATESLNNLNRFKNKCEQFILNQIRPFISHDFTMSDLKIEKVNNLFGINPFFVEIGEYLDGNYEFSLNAPTTIFNSLRLLRGMQLNKAILLEGSPGVGKTSLVTALAKFTGHKIFRVNLSDQTDISDLFGADLPVEGGTGGQFSWRDGPLLQALKQGHWILLDELNLASQSVLEGLNACLDHRGEIFIPELGKTFLVENNTRFFACQNPLKQGGSRRGLPKSFLNRFIQVYIDALTDQDLLVILRNQFNLPEDLLGKMIVFNTKIIKELNHFGHKGSPWEFNLRDLTRWCEAVIYKLQITKKYEVGSVVQLIYSDRMRTLNDRNQIKEIFEQVFQCKITGNNTIIYINNNRVYFGDVFLNRNNSDANLENFNQNCLVLRSQLSVLRSLTYCINLNWMCLLVGSSASGKSSVVRTLANLVGKTLKTLPVTSAMDTTDILGGFEQTDYSRHLDEIVKKTESILLESVQNLLINQEDDEAQRLLQFWENFLILNSECNFVQTMENETKLFLRKVTKLETIWEHLCNLNCFIRKSDINKLQNKAEFMANCVRNDGSLNAGGKFEWVDSVLIKCLEEGSWLLIDNVNLCSAAVLDRLNALLEPNGVLTIGERGISENGQMIEIKPHKDFRLFLTMDPKNGEISRAMRNRGVEIYLLNENECERNEFDVKSLINVKGLENIEYIKSLLKIHDFISDLVLGDKPNINELLQSSLLISQQISHGFDVFDAFFTTILEVYYKSRFVSEFNCNNVIEVIKNKLKSILDNSDGTIELYNGNCTLKTKKLRINSSVEVIKQQASAIEQLFNNENLLKYLLIHFYSISSLNDLNIRHIYLIDLLKRNSLNNLIKTADSMKKTIKQFRENPNLAIDFRWIPDTFYPGKDVYQTNKLTLVLYIIAEYEKEILDIERLKNPIEISLFEYMKNKKTYNKDYFDDVIIQKTMDLLNAFDCYLKGLMNEKVEINNENLIDVLYLMSWRFIFQKCTLVNVKKINENQRYLINTNLKVHYEWFLKAINKISAILNVKFPTKLNEIIKIINNSLDKQFSVIFKIGKNYQKFTEKPPPFVTETQISVKSEFSQMCQLYNLCDKRENICRILNIFKNNDIRCKLIEMKVALNFNLTDNSNQMNEFKLMNNLNNEISNDYNYYELELLPYIDYYVQLAIKDLISNKKFENSEFLRNVVTIPIEFIGVLLQYNQTEDNRLNHEITKLLFYYLLNSASVRPNKYLANLKEINTQNPILVNYLCNLLIEKNSLITLGNFRDLLKQHRFLKTMLWANMPQLSEKCYDYLYFEQQYIVYSFNRFIIQIAKSLNVNANISIEHLKMKNCSEQFTSLLESCKNHIEQIDLTLSINHKISLISSVYMELSYLKLCLNSQLSLIDPLAKKTLKKKYCSEAIDNFDNFKRSYEILNQVYCNNRNNLHELYFPVNSKLRYLYEKNKNLGKYLAVRPKNVPYETILKAINYGFSTILSSDFVGKTMLTLNNTISHLLICLENNSDFDSNDGLKVLNQFESNFQSLNNLLYEWWEYSNSYPDIVEPILANVSEFLYGFKTKIVLFKKLLQQYSFKRNGIDINHEILKLLTLPSFSENQINYEMQINSYTNNKFYKLVNLVVENEEIYKLEHLRLLKCGIQETFNNFIIETSYSDIPNKKLFQQFSKFLQEFVNAWNKQEEDRKIKQEEADCLYKTKVKCNDKTEEEQIESELNKLFPNFQDFSDIQKSRDSSEDIDEISGCISNDDLKFIVDIHINLLQNYTKTEWLNPEKKQKNQANLIFPIIEKYQLFKRILTKTIHCLDYDLDKELLGSFSVLLSVVQKYGDTSGLVVQSSPTRNITKHDFYRDSNVDEVKSCHYILEELKVQVTEYHNEWPDHPTLKTILTIIDRIRNFEITSPISRFLAGFELLLTKCNEWEEVAHFGVSLSKHSENITQQVILWRKMELNVWKDLLNSTFDRLNEPQYKWWIYMYNIMQQFVKNEINTSELIETLQLFITKSNLAEFESRLNLFYIFHCHATYLERTRKSEIFINILWNLYNYFNAFLLNVTNKIKDLRAPIEKKLRDYVKIVRWKDINYWTIKQTIDKTHKTLHKFIREFQDILNQSVSSCLINVDKVDDNNGIWDRPQRRSVKTYHYTLEPSTYMVKQSLKKIIDENEGILGKIDSYFNKSRVFCKEAILGTKYPVLVQSLDGFVTEIIENSSHLQKLEIDTTLPKTKQKLQAKSILQRKQRALADLFKTLSKIGLSFRTGIIELKLKSFSDDFLIRPIDISANFQHINYNGKDKKIITIWENCEVYYNKSLIRADVLETALKNPAQDLGLQNIERCKGFSSHLLLYIQQQKTQLVETSRIFYYLRFYTTQLMEICNNNQFLPIETVEKIQDILKTTLITMNQIKIILNSCPVEDSTSEIFVLKSNVKFIQYQNDCCWNQINNSLTEVVCLSCKVMKNLEKAKGKIPCVEYDLIVNKFIPVNMEMIQSDLNEISEKMSEIQANFGDIPISKSLNWLNSEINNLKLTLNETSENEIIDIKPEIEKISEEILVIIQNIYKKYKQSEESENSELQEEHLKSLIIGNLSNDLSLLNLQKIFKLIHNLVKKVFLTHPRNIDTKLISQCLPLIEQIILLYQYFVTQQVSAYRITCKMTSVLLNIFIDLASKGFCVPPELSDENESDGIGKPSNGLGLGEGQGERDVSDKIESEDQLEDAQPEGQEKQQENTDCKEEDKGIEMSEDFDNKLQDIDKRDDDNEETSDNDAEEQMGETEENADRLDKEIWGSDDENDENNDESNEKGDKGEKESDHQLGAKENESKTENNDKSGEDGDEKEQSKKDINEMEEPEYDDDQIDPYHGNQPELPEPEPMELPDDVQLDDEGENADETQEENPFDIDTMKDQTVPPENKEEQLETEPEKRDEVDEFSSEDEDCKNETDRNDEQQQNNEEIDKSNSESTKENEEELNEEKNEEKSTLDLTQTNEENVEAMEVDNAEAIDKTQCNQSENQKSNQPIDDLCQEDKPDKEGIGQSQMEESKSGHSAQTTKAQEIDSNKRQYEEEKIKKQKPGDSDSQRSLGDIKEPVKKKLKTMDSKNDNFDEKLNETEAEIYKHIKEAKEETSIQVLDAATKEQAETQQVPNLDEDEAEEPESSNTLVEEEEEEKLQENMEISEIKQNPEKIESKNKKNDKKSHDGDILDEFHDVNVEGDIVETSTVARCEETTYHTQYNNVMDITTESLSVEQINGLRTEVEQQLSAWNESPCDAEAERAWQKISSMTSSLAQDLSEQLRLVLEPTQASRLKGDFRTGKRINMRKVIPYIASQFRKDKIWLRRTKPSKREYQIVLAIDDSSSMADNRSKELAFESVSLISKALTLLESGQLSVLSFGKTTDILHKLTDQFTDKSGVELLQKFKFDQTKTDIAKLVDFVTEMFNQTHIQTSVLNAKLLIIVSDGRGVFSEGENKLRQAVRRAKLSNIFMVFVIIDNPENKNSILDIRMFKNGKLLNETYMDLFPFNFYIILKDITSLPNVLSDALRQWFEVVSNLDKQ